MRILFADVFFFDRSFKLVRAFEARKPKVQGELLDESVMLVLCFKDVKDHLKPLINQDGLLIADKWSQAEFAKAVILSLQFHAGKANFHREDFLTREAVPETDEQADKVDTLADATDSKNDRDDHVTNEDDCCDGFDLKKFDFSQDEERMYHQKLEPLSHLEQTYALNLAQ